MISKMLEQKRGSRTWKELAAEMNCSAAYLSDVLNGRREPGPKILEYLGLEWVLVKRSKSRKRQNGGE